MTNYLELLNMKATELASKYCDQYNKGAKQKELRETKKAATKAVDAYNLELSKEKYREWDALGNPVETAIRSRIIPGAIRFQFKEKDEIMGFVVKAAEYPVSLPMMQIVLGKKVFAEADWFDALEKLCLLTLNYLNEKCGNGSFNYQVAEASKEFNFPDGVDPLSEDGVVHALQCVVDKVLFIEDPKTGENIIHTTTGVDSLGHTYSKEWTVIRESMTVAGGVNKVAVCNTVKFSEYLLNAMHGMLTNGSFGLVTDEEYFGMKALEIQHKNSQLTQVAIEGVAASQAEAQEDQEKVVPVPNEEIQPEADGETQPEEPKKKSKRKTGSKK